MENNVYARLRRFLDTLPTGYPETPTGVEIKILKRLFTPEQAELTMKLKPDLEMHALRAVCPHGVERSTPVQSGE